MQQRSCISICFMETWSQLEKKKKLANFFSWVMGSHAFKLLFYKVSFLYIFFCINIGLAF